MFKLWDAVRYHIQLELRGSLSGPVLDYPEIPIAVVFVVMRFDLPEEPWIPG